MIGKLLSLFGGVFNSAVWILAGVLALTLLGGYIWIGSLRSDLDTKKKEIADLQISIHNLTDTNKHQTTVIKNLSDELVAQAKAFANREELFKKIRVKFVPVIKEIERAPETDNGPLAPVLRNTLDQLRRIREERKGGDQNRDRASELPGRTPGGDTSPRTAPVAR
jgi:hypothetical protein